MSQPMVRIDDHGFPMVWISNLGTYLHWLPITKVQFEYFLAETRDGQFDEQWYTAILGLNPRIAPQHISHTNYWRIFITGVKPGEAQHFARWYGPKYRLPSLAEWNIAYQALKQQDPLDLKAALSLPGLNQRARTMLQQLDPALALARKQRGYRHTRAEQLLLRLGVLEWVECRDQAGGWGGIGETYDDFYRALYSPEGGQPRLPADPENQRIAHYGFRMLWSPA